MDFKIVIKQIKPKKPKETDPVKIEAMKEKRRLQREAKKTQEPKEPKKPKEPKPNYSDQLEVINKTLKNIVGLNIDEINAKLKPLQTQAEENNKKSKKKIQ